VKIWTDASTYPKNPGHMGLAYAADVEGTLVLGRAYGGHGTSNQAELLAIHFALDALGVKPSDDVTLYTDSQYSLKLIDGTWHWGVYGWLVRAIRMYGVHIEGLLIDLVRGHRGIAGNEQADYGAYQGALKGMNDPLCPLYVIRDQHTRLLEAHIMPLYSWLPADLKQAVGVVHERVRHGKRNMDDAEQLIIQSARKALEEITCD
jgi:ribonuclease HI